MYLSRIELNPQRRDTIKALASPQIIHAAVKSGFPTLDSGAERVLWRLDKIKHALYLLVLSPRKPDFTSTVEQFGWPASGQVWETKNYDVLLDIIESGQRWLFRLCANPTKSISGEKGQRGKVSGLSPQEQLEWLVARMDKNGFTLTMDDFAITQRTQQKFRRANETITLSTATFEGRLTVNDAALFKKALVYGVGRAKAYGCGLLTVAGTS